MYRPTEKPVVDMTLTYAEAMIILRRRKGWKQSVLADKVGLELHRINCIESGRNGTTARRLSQIFEALDYPVEIVEENRKRKKVKAAGRRIAPNRLSVTIRGVTYPSIRQAMNDLNMGYYNVVSLAKGENGKG